MIVDVGKAMSLDFTTCPIISVVSTAENFEDSASELGAFWTVTYELVPFTVD